jgi:hypothetical protein
MNNPDSQEFYVGYETHAPKGIARYIRVISSILLAIAALAGVALIFSQNKFALSIFEFQQYKHFEGELRLKPYPLLMVSDQNKSSGETQYLLTAAGKHGAFDEVAAYDGRRVRLEGSLIYRDGIQMIEIAPNSVQAVSLPDHLAALPTADEGSLGSFTLKGEIVDSKCYLGVMNPGHTKPHRECAVRCISGGVPPGFIAHDAQGNSVFLLLVTASGEPANKVVLDFIAEPVEISGEVLRNGSLLVFRADLQNIIRLK